MSEASAMERLDAVDKWLPEKTKTVGIAAVLVGIAGVGLGFADGAHVGWSALLSASVLVMGIAAVGPLLSAIFEMTGAKWARPYRRLAEGTVVLMPVALVMTVVLLAFGNHYLPWVAEPPHHGGKHIWLTRGFFDVRVIVSLLIVYGIGLMFVRFSVRRDFCVSGVSGRFDGLLKRLFAANIADPEKETARASRAMSRLAPVVAIAYGVCLSMIGFDWIMALEPDWFSTLFGAWYFVGALISGMALVALFSTAISKRPGMDRFFTTERQSDMATLLLAFALINGDFFWNQYLTIWYTNLPEETFYLMKRTEDVAGMPWRGLSFAALAGFFLIPFTALLLRKVKRNRALLSIVSIIAVTGVLLARFVEIAPAIHAEGGAEHAVSLLGPIAALMVLAGLLGVGAVLFARLFSGVPILCVGDPILAETLSEGEVHS